MGSCICVGGVLLIAYVQVLARVVVVLHNYVCDTFDRRVWCKLGLSAELVGTGELSSDRVRR